ncbi:MAG: isopropylmalate synthase [Solibacillus sp.]|uniref:isopropylmalate synthase n=1 Tax=unclassified Solibacillus TaxID=2637870 RepID=UPI003101AB23
MKKLEWFDNLQNSSDEQLQQFAGKNDLHVTLDEVKKLRKIMRHANISWAITGVPQEVLQKVHKLLGSKRYKQLMKLVGI